MQARKLLATDFVAYFVSATLWKYENLQDEFLAEIDVIEIEMDFFDDIIFEHVFYLLCKGLCGLLPNIVALDFTATVTVVTIAK